MSISYMQTDSGDVTMQSCILFGPHSSHCHGDTGAHTVVLLSDLFVDALHQVGRAWLLVVRRGVWVHRGAVKYQRPLLQLAFRERT